MVVLVLAVHNAVRIAWVTIHERGYQQPSYCCRMNDL